jgi:putative membrane protein
VRTRNAHRRSLAVSTDALKLERRLNGLAWVLTAVVLVLVSLMRVVRIHSPIDFSFLPPLHASLNALTAVALMVALAFIKSGQIARHRAAIYTAIGLSVLFLLSYVLYHFTSAEVRYGDVNHDGIVDAVERAAVSDTRPVYLALLISHITLAGGILPFILLTFNRAFTGQYLRHKAMARWVFPVWLYVAVSGPVCYLMLRRFYP